MLPKLMIELASGWLTMEFTRRRVREYTPKREALWLYRSTDGETRPQTQVRDGEAGEHKTASESRRGRRSGATTCWAVSDLLMSSWLSQRDLERADFLRPG